MNKLILMGRLTRDPEVKYSQGANMMAIANFSVAVDRRIKREGEAEADFFRCTAFGKTAEFVEKYLTKGVKVAIVGRIQNDNYVDKNGNQQYSMTVYVDDIEFCESKNASGTGNSGTAKGGAFQTTNSDGFMNIPTGIGDDLPFA